jgi:hypothetical protein
MSAQEPGRTGRDARSGRGLGPLIIAPMPPTPPTRSARRSTDRRSPACGPASRSATSASGSVRSGRRISVGSQRSDSVSRWLALHGGLRIVVGDDSAFEGPDNKPFAAGQSSASLGVPSSCDHPWRYSVRGFGECPILRSSRMRHAAVGG